MKTLTIGGITLKNRYIMAPLAGYTNRALRTLAGECGAALTYTEMISANALLYQNAKTSKMLPSEKEETPVALQLFGGDRETVFKAAELVEKKARFDFLDFNMGCPVPKVMRQKAGSYWLKREDEIYELLRGLVARSARPVILKARLGFDQQHQNILSVLEIAAQAGISALAIHGRTRDQYYAGTADYTLIKEAVKRDRMPIIANGDLAEENLAAVEEETGAAGFMFGRQALGHPLIFHNLVAREEKKAVMPPSFKGQKELLLRHFELLEQIKPEQSAIKDLRGLGPLYFKGFPGASKIRAALVRIDSRKDLLQTLENLEDLSCF